MADETRRADAVVIGSGAGGAPAAALLAEAGLRVVVLEAGPRLETADFDGREGSMLPRLFVNRAADDSGMAVFGGSCVGGSTVVNDALCWRTPPEVLAAWRDRWGLETLTEPAWAPWVERAWRDVHATPTDRAHLNRNAHRLELGAGRLGWRAEAAPRNVIGCANLGLCNLGCPTGAKQSMLVTYVPRAERAGAEVLARTRAERIEHSGGSVRAVEAVRADGARVRVEAPRVVAAAGVLATPALLLRSGLPAPAASRVGEDVQLHSSLSVSARFREPVHPYYGPTMAYAVTEFADVHGRTGTGFLLENAAALPASASMALPGFGADHERAMRALPFQARCIVLLHDRTRGRIHLDDEGRARLRYTPTAEDFARLREGLVAAAQAWLAAGALEVWLPIQAAPSLDGARNLVTAVPPLDASRTADLYAVHLFGGAAMGGSPERGVCDVSGEVFGVRGLYVADASALPSNTGVNPQITILANALRIASGIAGAAEAA